MERYMKKFLDELPSQTIFENIQVVLDHNEPSDQELEWVKEFQKKHPGRLKHIVTDPVKPIGTSMNKCIEEAGADIVTIWNVDDLRTPDSLEAQLKVFQENKDVGVVHGNFVIVNEFGKTHGQYIDHTGPTFTSPKELTRGMFIGPFFAFRKALVKDIGYFDEQLVSGADFDLAIRLAKATKVDMTYEILGYYLDEGRGASTRGDGNQPVERTLIEMRHGIFDKMDQRLVPEVQKRDYDVDHIVNFGKKIKL
jgi:GT2 family glycosyltransferase